VWGPATNDTASKDGTIKFWYVEGLIPLLPFTQRAANQVRPAVEI
jgi:hypothetical protein